MNINTLLDDITFAIASDENLASWCSLTYSKTATVLDEFDEQDPPGESDCPYVAVQTESKTVGVGIQDKTHEFMVVCGLYDDTTETGPLPNMVKSLGVRRIETMRKYVETAIAGVDIGNVELKIIGIEYKVGAYIPFRLAGMNLIFSEKYTLGTDPLE